MVAQFDPEPIGDRGCLDQVITVAEAEAAGSLLRGEIPKPVKGRRVKHGQPLAEEVRQVRMLEQALEHRILSRLSGDGDRVVVVLYGAGILARSS